ncbi:hypothetical protein HA402_008400 [Bradysia odoriphaga]|nr:hypothetical protein HA402_008400 [Bradysia odoriphaga]
MASPSITGPPPGRIRQTPAKPRITINIPPQHGYAANSPYLSTGPHTAHSNSTVAPGAPQWPMYENPFTGANMYKQIGGLWDFTTASARSGLGFGEKFALYIYEKFSKWSKKWFTHIFLFLCIFLYTLAGAYIFQAAEAENQQKGFRDFHDLRANLSTHLQIMARAYPGENQVDQLVTTFLNTSKVYFDQEKLDLTQTKLSTQWNNTWSAMFFCGTVFTTIAIAKY